MKPLRLFFLGWICFLPSDAGLLAQTDSLQQPLTVQEIMYPKGGYTPFDHRLNLDLGLDVYTSYGLNETGNALPGYFYSYNRQGETTVNLGYLRGSYDNGRIKAHLGLMAGTYTNANMAAEPATLRNLFEAYVGVSLSERRTTWIEAGVFDSHIGFESPVGHQQFTLTRGILSENTPYFLSGVRLMHSFDNDKVKAGLLVLNGWQVIQRPYTERRPAFGHTLTFTPRERLSFHSNSYFGYHIGQRLTDGFEFQPFTQTVLGNQFMHDLHVKGQWGDRIEWIAGCDVGFWHPADAPMRFSTGRFWFAPSLIVAHEVGRHSRIAARIEHMNDSDGALIYLTGVRMLNGFNTATGFEQKPFVVTGASVNFDHRIAGFAMWRLEARALYSDEAVFPASFFSEEPASRTLVFFTTSLNIQLFR